MRYSNPETRFVEKMLPKWIAEYESGKTATWIADKYSVHTSTVYRRLKQSGVIIRTIGAGKLGSLNPNWRENPSYGSVHVWVTSRMPKPKICPNCGLRPALDLANIENHPNPVTYTRDLSNWEWLCRKCHMTKDGRIKNMYHGGKPKLRGKCSLCDNPHKARGFCTVHYYQEVTKAKQ